MFEGFDPLAPEAIQDPFPFMAKARRETPVFYMPDYDQWCVTKHRDLLEIYRDPISYSNGGNWKLRVPRPDALADEIPDGWEPPMNGLQLNATDPPQHTRIRKLMQGAFTPRRINERQGLIKDVADDLIDAFEQDGEADFVAQFASPLPISVVSGIVGMPKEQGENWRPWAEDWFTLTGATELPEEEAIERWTRLYNFDCYLREFVADRRRQPQDDLTSDLIAARGDDGSQMSDDEVLGNIMGVVLAGADTTTILLSHAIYLLLSNPDTLAEVRENLDLVPNVVEETLRILGPVRGVNRTTTTDVELGGVKIPKGSTLYIHLASSGRDEDVFEEPERFDIHRPNANKHLGFGIWAHFCIGAPLARLEGRIALSQIIERLPDLAFASDQGRLEYAENMILPTVRRLQLTW